MSNKKIKGSKKKNKNKSSQKKAQKKVAISSSKNTIGDFQVVNISIEEILDRIAAYERKGDITHAQAFEGAERYANIKPGEVVIPKEMYDFLVR